MACAGAGILVLIIAGSIAFSTKRAAAAPAALPEIAGTYELTSRVMSSGEVLRPPKIVALYTLDHGRGNFNLFVKAADGRLASESTISRYTLSATSYCEWIVYTTRNNLDKPGVTNEGPPVTNHCNPVVSKDGRTVFVPPGEGGIETSFEGDGFTADIPGQFVDHWQKVR